MAEMGAATAGVSTVGLTVLGVSTGLAPELLIAGFAGGMWAQSYLGQTPYAQRLGLTLLASLLAGYFAPALAIGLTAMELVRGVFPGNVLQLPIAVLVGFLAHRIGGPAIMRIVRKKTEDLTK